MMIYNDTMGLENLIQRSIRVSQRLTACHLNQFPLQSPPALAPGGLHCRHRTGKPMDANTLTADFLVKW